MAQYTIKELLARALPVAEGSDHITVHVSDSNLVNFSELAKEGLSHRINANGLVVFITIKKSDGSIFTEEELKELGLR